MCTFKIYLLNVFLLHFKSVLVCNGFEILEKTIKSTLGHRSFEKHGSAWQLTFTFYEKSKVKELPSHHVPIIQILKACASRV